MSQQNLKSEFEQLLLRNRGRLTAIAHSYADGETEDLLQEILLQIWRGMVSFQRRSSIDTWCYRVALNTAISWRRTNGRRKDHFPLAALEVEQLAGTQDGSDLTRLLQMFIRTLSDLDRALILMYLDDFSGEEMAQAMGINLGAVRVRIHRIKQRLAEWNVGDQ